MNSLDKSSAYGVANHVSRKILYIFLLAHCSIVIALLPQPPSPSQRLINGQTATRFDAAHHVGQCSIPQLQQAVHMIRHQNPGQKIRPTLRFQLAQLSDDQSPQPPISKKRLSLVNDSRYQINTSRFGKTSNTQATSIRKDRHSIASLSIEEEVSNLQRCLSAR